MPAHGHDYENINLWTWPIVEPHCGGAGGHEMKGGWGPSS